MKRTRGGWQWAGGRAGVGRYNYAGKGCITYCRGERVIFRLYRCRLTDLKGLHHPGEGCVSGVTRE